jgi:hypothetical protein
MSEPAWDELARLDEGTLQTELLRIADAAMAGKTGADEEVAARELPEPVKMLWLLSWLDFEVSQGSLLAFFYNSHGRFASDAADALNRIGAQGMAQILRQAEESVRRNTQQWDAQRAETDEAGEYAVVHPYRDLIDADELDALTDRYWAAAEADDWGAKLDRYLRAAVEMRCEDRS